MINSCLVVADSIWPDSQSGWVYNWRLSPRMMLQDRGLPGGGVDVGVDLGGEDEFVAEHFLDDAEVGAVFDEVGGEGVAEGVRGDFLADSCGHRMVPML